MENTEVIAVPRIGFKKILTLAKDEAEKQHNSLEAVRGWMPHKKWEKLNIEYLDLTEWIKAAEQVL